VSAAIAGASEAGRDVLQAYGERMASLAVRENDSTFLTRGLVATVVGGLTENDREAMMVMPLIENSAKRLGVNPSRLFEQTAGIVGPRGTLFLMRWLARHTDIRRHLVPRYVLTDHSGR
jgi:predicted amino acid dehydrogenase